MHNESTLVTSDLDKASLFNNFFVSVHSKALPVQLLPNQPSSVVNDIDITVTVSDVLAALSRLDPSKATGLDGIGPKILKTCSEALCSVISHLFNISLKFSRIYTVSS